MEYMLTKVLEIISGPLSIRFDGKDYSFNCGKEALSFKIDSDKWIELKSIDAMSGELIVCVEESKYAPHDMKEKWVQEFYKQ